LRNTRAISGRAPVTIISVQYLLNMMYLSSLMISEGPKEYFITVVSFKWTFSLVVVNSKNRPVFTDIDVANTNTMKKTALGLYCSGLQIARYLSVETATTSRTETVMQMLPKGHKTLLKMMVNHCGSFCERVTHTEVRMKKAISSVSEIERAIKS
jgi:hypothetical protein